MQTALDCVPCFTRQALETARFVTDDPVVHEEIIREVLRAIAEMSYHEETPPGATQKIHRILRQITGSDDPYRQVKQHFNQMALNMYPVLAQKVQAADSPLETAIMLSIAGNVIDFGVNGSLTQAEAQYAIETALEAPFYGEMEEFLAELQAAQNVLYLADNAGEIVFDRLLIELLRNERVTLAVRGRPILNDAILEDAKVAGLCELVNVIDNGSDAPGTILSECSADFQHHFRNADLIIAKGQGNFETLNEEKAPVTFLFKVKCPIISNHVGIPLGTHVLMKSSFGK